MSGTVVQRDERTVAVENASYRWAYLLLSFGLLLTVAYRSFVYQESPWDLLGLVILAGLFTAAYQGAHHVLTRRWAWTAGVSMLLAALFAAGLAALLAGWR
jgi:hypothetical protein